MLIEKKEMIMITKWVPVSLKPKGVRLLVSKRKNTLAYQGDDSEGTLYKGKGMNFFKLKDKKWFKLVKRRGD